MVCELVESEALVVLAWLLRVGQVMDAELVEVTHDDGVRPLRVRHGVRVGLRLLERCDLAPLASLGLVEADAQGLLLDKGLCVGDDDVDVATGDSVLLETDGGSDILHADDIAKEFQPEALGVFFLIAAAGPFSGELACCALLLCGGLCHG